MFKIKSMFKYMFMVKKGLLNWIKTNKCQGQVNAFMINLMFIHKSLNVLDYKLKFSGQYWRQSLCVLYEMH